MAHGREATAAFTDIRQQLRQIDEMTARSRVEAMDNAAAYIVDNLDGRTTDVSAFALAFGGVDIDPIAGRRPGTPNPEEDTFFELQRIGNSLGSLEVMMQSGAHTFRLPANFGERYARLPERAALEPLQYSVELNGEDYIGRAVAPILSVGRANLEDGTAMPEALLIANYYRTMGSAPRKGGISFPRQTDMTWHLGYRKIFDEYFGHGLGSRDIPKMLIDRYFDVSDLIEQVDSDTPAEAWDNVLPGLSVAQRPDR
ncbi:hypothetical protein KDA23_06395 [Candidatus Saccharibacteria bacterium]|nr:hypothetical protein [Candidatus Saccharibacteria bacterium]